MASLKKNLHLVNDELSRECYTSPTYVTLSSPQRSFHGAGPSGLSGLFVCCASAASLRRS
jgi:hypothetical protein